MSDFITKVMPQNPAKFVKERKLENKRYHLDFITDVKRERELFEAGNLTNNLDLSDSSDDQDDPHQLPFKQFDKYPKTD